MKTILLGLLLLGFAGEALAVEPAELDGRLRRLTGMFEELQSKPDRCIPPDVLNNAQGIVLLDRTKAGFVFAFQGGVGVAMVKDPVTKKWSAPAFLMANEASLGFQVGGEQSFYAILLMTTNDAQLLGLPVGEIGSEARGTAGEVSRGASSKVSPLEHQAIVYSDRNGFFGGADVKTGAITPDTSANYTYYGGINTSMHDILFGHAAKPTEAGIELTQSIMNHSKPPEQAKK